MATKISPTEAKRLWIHAQKLDTAEPFGRGPEATKLAVEHLGYVQIDTINVIERCHHHILFTRIPHYRKSDLLQAQSVDKSVFEYWTHALAYVPTRDFPYFIKDMQRREKFPSQYYQSVTKAEQRKVLAQIKKHGALSIRDFEDEVLVEKNHPWASRKPSKRVLQFSFHAGHLVISKRLGMLKKYELTERHFEWEKWPKAASEKEILEYTLQRALRSQAFVSLDSVCYLEKKPFKMQMQRLIDSKVKTGLLVPLVVTGSEKVPLWTTPEVLDSDMNQQASLTHILSPFDPLVIQRKRLQMLFDYEHRFEAYLPKPKRVLGYFALPVLIEDQIVAAIDLKTDREAGKLLVQQWTWLGKHKSRANKLKIEEELHRFAKFQLGDSGGEL